MTQVLLADGWHDVTDRTFRMDAYDYVDDCLPKFEPILRSGSIGGVPDLGAEWKAEKPTEN